MSREVKEYFDQVSSRWDKLRQGFYSEEVRDAVLTAALINPTDTVLDVGAGTGFLTEGAAKLARKVVALDLSRSMTEEAISKLYGKNVEFKIGDVEQIPLADSSVDSVIGNMILHHCPRPGLAVKEMARVLVPGGRLVLSDLQEHNYESLQKDHSDLWPGFKMAHVKSILDEAQLERVNVETLGCCCATIRESVDVKIPMFLATARKKS